MQINSKLPNVGISIFPQMTALARQHGAVNLAQGFPGFSADRKLLELIHDYTLRGYNQYAPLTGLPALKEKIAEKIEDQHGKYYHPESEIVITCGATQALYSSITCLVNPGDEVIIIEPAFDSYEPAVILNGGIPVRSSLSAGNYQINWEDVKQKITPKTKLIITNTPHNPTGVIWTENDIQQLSNIVRGTNIFILSDEVYEHIVFDGKKHLSICAYPELAERALVVYSFGKTYHLTGWRIGYVVGPKFLISELVKCHQFQIYSVNTPIQHALVDYAVDKEAYLGLNQFFQKKRDYFLSAVEGSLFKPLSCEGTYFVLLDYQQITRENDVEFAYRLTKDYGVASIPISGFYQSKRQDQVLRFCFAKTDEELEKGAAALHKVAASF